MQHRLIYFMLLISMISSCAVSSKESFTKQYGEPLRLVVTPGSVWFDKPGTHAYVETYVATDEENRVFVAATYTESTSGIVEVKTISTGKFQLKALAKGETTLNFKHRIGMDNLEASLSVRVQADVITLGGFDRAPVFEMISSTGNFNQTLTEVGGDEGCAEFFVFRDKLYTVSSDSKKGDSVEIFDKYSLTKLKSFTYTPRRYMQKLILLSPDRGILLPQLPDSNSDENFLIIDLDSGSVLEKVVIPNNTGFNLWLADAVIKNDRMFISTTPFDNNAWAFRQCYLIIVDLTNMTVVDADLSDPDIDFVALPYENPRRLYLEDDGDLLVFCAGNDLSTPKAESAVLIYDTNSFKLKKTCAIGQNGYLGVKPVADNTGRLYLADQYKPNIFSFDLHTDTLLRDMSNVMYFPPPQAIGFGSGAVIDNKLLMTNPYGYLVQSIDISKDDNASAVPYQFHLKMNTAFTHIVSRKDKNEPAYAKRLMNPENLQVGNDAAKAFGKPEGAGAAAASTDVIEIGDDAIIFAFDERKCVNRPGADFVVFTGAKYRSSDKPQDFDASAWRDMTPAKVSVSMDGETWTSFPSTENNTYNVSDPRHYEGSWAGINPTIVNSVNNLNVEFTSAGGDRFDLSAIGLDEIRYIKIEGKGCKIDAITLLNNLED